MTHDRPAPTTANLDIRVAWLRDEAGRAERDVQQLVTVLAKQRKGQT